MENKNNVINFLLGVAAVGAIVLVGINFIAIVKRQEQNKPENVHKIKSIEKRLDSIEKNLSEAINKLNQKISESNKVKPPSNISVDLGNMKENKNILVENDNVKIEIKTPDSYTEVKEDKKSGGW